MLCGRWETASRSRACAAPLNVLLRCNHQICVSGSVDQRQNLRLIRIRSSIRALTVKQHVRANELAGEPAYGCPFAGALMRSGVRKGGRLICATQAVSKLAPGSATNCVIIASMQGELVIWVP